MRDLMILSGFQKFTPQSIPFGVAAEANISDGVLIRRSKIHRFLLSGLGPSSLTHFHPVFPSILLNDRRLFKFATLGAHVNDNLCVSFGILVYSFCIHLTKFLSPVSNVWYPTNEF